MTAQPPKARRWLKSVLATAARETAALPFQRGQKRRPAALRAAAPQRPGAIAAH